MCSGNAGRRQHHAEEEARRRQAQADAEARRRQEQLAQLAREREATATAQQAQLVALQQQQTQAEAQQSTEVQQLTAQQRERLAGIDARGQAVTQSLQILANETAGQGPTAAVDATRRTARGARTTTAALRMGAGSYGAGSGANFSV